MKITIEPTSEITKLNGHLARIWNGVTDSGLRVEVFVVALAAREDADCLAFDRELLRMPPPAEAITPLSEVCPARPLAADPSRN